MVELTRYDSPVIKGFSLSSSGDARALPLLRSRMVSRSQVSLLVQAHHHQSRIECSTLDAGRTDVHSKWRAQSQDETTRLKNNIILNVLFKPNFSNVLSRLNSSTSKYLPQFITVEGEFHIAVFFNKHLQVSDLPMNDSAWQIAFRSVRPSKSSKEAGNHVGMQSAQLVKFLSKNSSESEISWNDLFQNSI